MHHSRLGVAVIDCKTTDLTEAVSFWSALLGVEGVVDDAGKYAVFEGQLGPRVLLQAVDHEPRVHLDFEADDKEAEVRRLRALGATEVARIKGWIVMQAPTGHRFCIVKPQGDDFPGGAVRWEA
jgi:catechol 2,3-dioxygenase-like lactoylglutathione lyase family enzyme